MPAKTPLRKKAVSSKAPAKRRAAGKFVKKTRKGIAKKKTAGKVAKSVRSLPKKGIGSEPAGAITTKDSGSDASVPLVQQSVKATKATKMKTSRECSA